jgi:hypothetical protein
MTPMEIAVALIGAVATITAAIISVRATWPARSSDAPRVVAVGVVSDDATPVPSTIALPKLSAGAAVGRIIGAFVAFTLSVLAFAVVINAVHDLDTGATSWNEPAVAIGMIVLVIAIAVLWNLARLLIRPVGTRSSLRSTLLLAVNGVTLAMMAGLWQG